MTFYTISWFFLFDPESSLIKCNSTYRQKNRKFILSCSHLYISITILSNYHELIIHLNNLIFRYLQLFDDRDVLKAMYGQENYLVYWTLDFHPGMRQESIEGGAPRSKKTRFWNIICPFFAKKVHFPAPQKA